MSWRGRSLDAVRTPLASAIGGALVAAGVDATSRHARRSCIVLAPHPDDETLGCAASIMRRLDAGVEVRVVVVSDGRTWPPHKTPEENVATRDGELRRACAALGLPEDAVIHLSFEEQRLAEAGPALVDAVADLVRAAQPDDVLCTSPADPHADHAALGRACAAALAGSGTQLLHYPIWQWTRPRTWLRSLRGTGRPELVSTAGCLERKREALAAFGSQLTVEAGGELEPGMGLDPPFLRHFLARHEMFLPSQQR